MYKFFFSFLIFIAFFIPLQNTKAAADTATTFDGQAQVTFEEDCMSFVLTNEGNDRMIERLVAAGCTSLYEALVYLRNHIPGDAPATLTGNMDVLINTLAGISPNGEVFAASLTDFVGGNNPVGINSDGTFIRADFSIYSYDGHPDYTRYSGNELYTYATSPDYYIYIGSNEVDLVGGIIKEINYHAFAVAWNMTNTLSVSTNTLNVASANGSTATFNVTSNTSWTAASNQTWLAVSPTSGSGNGTVTVTAQANPLSTTRTATVTVSGSGVTSQTVTVTQAAGVATLSILPTTLDIGATEGSTATFNVTSNISWTAASNQTWLAVSPASDTGDSIITVTAQANPLSTTRTAMVTVSGSGVTSQTVTVTQAAGVATLSILPTTLDIGATEGSTATFNITSNTNWTILSDQDWLSVNPASGTGDSIITVTAQANPSASARTAIVTVSATGVDSQTITVTQEMGTGITEIEAGKCAIYPNPFTNGFYVGNDHHTMIVSMFDVRGQLIFTRKVLGIEFIPTAQLANGIYLIELTNENTIMRIKVIKQ
jgi:hypothetical protein